MKKCIKCAKPAVADIAYAGTSLCREHFNEFFERKVRDANREFAVLRRGDRIIVGVSGGKDSSAMLTVLKKMADDIGAVQLFPVLVDEGIAGYRPKATAEAKKLCKQLGLKLVIVSFRKEFGLSLDQMIARRNRKWKNEGKRVKACSYCGVLRRRALEVAAKRLKANKVAIGHNADDAGQTLLMNVLRGEPQRIPRFLAGEAGEEGENGFARRVRPLIFCSERECALYCMLNGLPFHLGECPYSGEAFRGIVKDFLNSAEEKYPGVKMNCTRSLITLSRQLESGKAKRKENKKCIKCGSVSSGERCKACEMLNGLR